MIHSYMTLHILYVLSLDGVTFVLLLQNKSKKKYDEKKKIFILEIYDSFFISFASQKRIHGLPEKIFFIY